MSKTQTVHASVYDYPVLYDAIFNSDWSREFKFLQFALRRFGGIEQAAQARLFEPACGTGRLMYQFAKLGTEISGCDLNPLAVQYCNARLRRHGLKETAFVADMCDVGRANAPDESFDAAFNLVSSFRHLETENQARAHLKDAARILKPGGLYILGIHLTPERGAPVCDVEKDTVYKWKLRVQSLLKVLNTNRKNRVETISFEFIADSPKEKIHVIDVFPFRIYTRAHFARLIKETGWFKIRETYDFNYDFSHPVPVDDESEDVVYILQKP